ncbi:hypothetical protein BH11PLA2_BH11PLA2_20420 [soil metagenome]
MAQRFRRTARHAFVQQLGGDPAGAAGIGDHAGERRFGEFAEQFVIVHTDDGNLIRNGNPDPAAGTEHFPAADIVAGHDAGTGFGLPITPGSSSPVLPHTNHDVMTISGIADVDTLTINIESLSGSGFLNTTNYSWTILTGGSVTGTPVLGTVTGTDFTNNLGGTFSLSTDTTHVYLNFVTAVSEPGSMALIATVGVLGLLRRQRRSVKATTVTA